MSGSRRENLTRRALNPETQQPDLEVTIREQRLRGIGERGNKADVFTAAYTLDEALKNPNAIFEGLRFDEDELRSCSSPGWLCYAYHPARKYNNEGQTLATPKGRIFLVFVNDDRVVYNWTWENADENALANGKYLPADYENRFSRQVY
jgi:hypothetical protein